MAISALSSSVPVRERPTDASLAHGELTASAVSWSAVIGGAFVAAALSLILLALGAGLGFSSISPWSGVGASISTVSMAAVGWIIAAQIMASAMGGYVAGRLRTRWVTVHGDEVYFRDTAHGLLVWAVGSVMTAGLLLTVGTSLASGVTHAGVAATAPAAADQNEMPHAYDVDGLFRSDHVAPDRTDAAVRAEVGRIFAHALAQGSLSPADKTYAGSLIAARTGLSQADAEQRVTTIVTNAQEALDTARKAAAKLSLWIFIALLSGAFFASVAATIGGRQRHAVQMI
jgi:hypothetical protein